MVASWSDHNAFSHFSKSPLQGDYRGFLGFGYLGTGWQFHSTPNRCRGKGNQCCGKASGLHLHTCYSLILDRSSFLVLNIFPCSCTGNRCRGMGYQCCGKASGKRVATNWDPSGMPWHTQPVPWQGASMPWQNLSSFCADILRTLVRIGADKLRQVVSNMTPSGGHCPSRSLGA
jgi:hypothetical protein